MPSAGLVLIYIKRSRYLWAENCKNGGERPVLSWISETIFHVFSWIPNWLYADDTPRYLIVRGMLGLLLIVLIVLVFALWRNWRQRDRTPERN